MVRMSNDHRLPIPLQFVGLTAVLVFCFSAATFFVYGYTVWQDWQLVISDPQHSYLMTVAQTAILTMASAVTFATLVKRSLRYGSGVAIAYLALLLFLHCWSSVSWWSAKGGWPHVVGSTSHVAALALKILVLGWLMTLLVKAWSTIRPR
jgi:hypothetical protein